MLKLQKNQFDDFLASLSAAGYLPLGPVIHEGVITYRPVEKSSDLPVGMTDVQSAGGYRLEHRDDSAYFGYVVGPQSARQFLNPDRKVLFQTVPDSDAGFTVKEPDHQPPRYAFVGLRACELAAVKIQDTVYTGSGFTDPVYSAHREGHLFIGVNCNEPGANCFCSSMQTGPTHSPGSGYDILLTEVIRPDGKDYFLVETGSDAGRHVLQNLKLEEAGDSDKSEAQALAEKAEESITKHMDTYDLRRLFSEGAESKVWQEVADRCLSCANCTLVCPTCFCSRVEDVNELDGSHARVRVWDSCFNADFSYIHGGSIRTSTASRYRQWITHKLSSWRDQFGSSGCVGCGRCITWCPPGIDITEEVEALRNESKTKKDHSTSEQR